MSTTTQSPSIEYYSVRTSKNTFESAKIAEWNKNHIDPDDRVLNCCAGHTKLDHSAEIVRNDKKQYRDGEKIDADHHVDVRNIDEVVEGTFDVIIHDPPFSTAKATNLYDTAEETLYTDEVINTLKSLLKDGGKLIQWSYAAQLNDGFTPENITIWQRLGRGKDYVSTVQVKTDSPTQLKQCNASVEYNPAIKGVSSDVTVGGNDAKNIDITVTNAANYPEELEDIITEQIAKEANGKTIILSDNNRIYRNYSSADIIVVGLDQVGADYHIDSRSLTDFFPENHFDTAIIDIDPHSPFCWQTYCPKIKKDGKTGYVKSLKWHLDKITKQDNGKIVQAAHTVTNMPSDFGYTRESVKIIRADDAVVNLFVTSDRQTTQCLDAFDTESNESTQDTSIDNINHWLERYEGEILDIDTLRYRTEDGGSFHHPAYAEACPNCGAMEGSWCHIDGEIIHTPHAERVKESRVSNESKISLKNPPVDYGLTEEQTDPARPPSAGGQKDTIPRSSSANDKNATLAKYQ